jgi:hypothetical protein
MADIYHYCKLNTAIEHILCDKRLLLSPIKNTNDPRENKSFDFGAITEFTESIGGVGTLMNVNKEVSEILRRDCKVICFSEDHNSISGYQLSRMWALYGDNHKGFCIKLDKEAFLNENANLINPDFFRKVSYKDFNPNLPAEKKWINHDSMNSMGIERYVLESFRPEHSATTY